MKRFILFGFVFFLPLFSKDLFAKEELFFFGAMWDDKPTQTGLIITKSGICFFNTQFSMAEVKTYFKNTPKFDKGLGIELNNKPYKQEFKHSVLGNTFTSDAISFEQSIEGWKAWDFTYKTDFKYTFLGLCGPITLHVKSISVVIREYPDNTNSIRYYFFTTEADND